MATVTTEPRHVALVRDFANTLDHEMQTDALTDAAGLARWLHEHGLLAEAEGARAADLRVAQTLREHVRSAMAAHHQPVRDARRAARAAAEVAVDLPLQVAFVGSDPRLHTVGAGASAALAKVLVSVLECRTDGSWQRLKLCPADDCRWAFYDTSKNRTRVWCSMGVCGNRSKTRAYRSRQGVRALPGAG